MMYSLNERTNVVQVEDYADRRWSTVIKLIFFFYSLDDMAGWPSWSKAFDSSSNLYGGVGSNPTPVTTSFPFLFNQLHVLYHMYLATNLFISLFCNNSMCLIIK